jgi:hypothetical protein
MLTIQAGDRAGAAPSKPLPGNDAVPNVPECPVFLGEYPIVTPVRGLQKIEPIYR